MAKFEGRGVCYCCTKGVDVYSDRNGMAYFNCGPCGVRVLHRNKRTSDAMLSRLDRDAEPDDGAPAVAALPAAAPEPERRQAARPAAPAPVQQQKPPAKKTGFLSNFTL
jgi:predicted  nucleic acid-binding Zn-ribbon protein